MDAQFLIVIYLTRMPGQNGGDVVDFMIQDNPRIVLHRVSHQLQGRRSRCRWTFHTTLSCFATSSKEKRCKPWPSSTCVGAGGSDGFIQPPSSSNGAVGCWKRTTMPVAFESRLTFGRTRYQELLQNDRARVTRQYWVAVANTESESSL